MLIDDDEAPINVRLTVDDSELREEGGAQRVTITATFIGNDTFAASKDVALTLTSDPEAGDATYSVAEEDPKITIGPGMSSGSTTVTIKPVNNVTYGEDIEITIVGTSSDVTVSNAMVTIFNEDFDGVLTVSPSMLSEKDGVREVMVTATLPPSSATTARTIALTMGIAGTTGRAGTTTDNVDYTADTDNPQNIVIEAGSTSATVTLKIDPIDDGLFEGDETILIIGEITDVDIEIKSASILLRDAQRAMITLTVDIEEILEAGGQPVEVTVTATQSTKITSPTVITLAKSGSAIKDEDYMVEGDGEITIDAAATVGTAVLTITPVDDLMFENMDGETIVIGGSTPEDNVIHPATIALIDNNMIPLASFTVDPVMIGEGDGVTAVMITVVLAGTNDEAGTSGEDITIGLSKPGTAELGVDFMLPGADEAPPFVIEAGESMNTKTVMIEPVDDMLYEGDEIINVTGITMIGDEAYGDPMVADITLVDNDPAPMISLAVDVDTIAEDGGPQDVTITATATSASAVDIPITLSKPGTAVIGEDFTVSSEQEDFTIVAGELTATKVVTITPIDDDIYEGDEHIMVNGTVPDPEGEADVEGAMITLTDDEMVPTVTLAVEPDMIAEGSEVEFTITATPSHMSAMPITIELDKSGGTAQPGADFEIVAATEGAFMIEALGESATKMVTLSALADMLYEQSEIIEVGGTSMAGDSEAMAVVADEITLTDGDMMPMVALSANVSEITENGEAVSVTVTATLDGLSSMPIMVELAKSGSAVKMKTTV